MKYVIICKLSGPAEQYQQMLMNDLANTFGLEFTRKTELPAHFTLKYDFETEDFSPVDEALKEFCADHKCAPVKIGGFGHFLQDVIFINASPSNKALATIDRFIHRMRQIPHIQWDRYDHPNLHFHITIAERTKEAFKQVWEYLQGKEEYFECLFDNVTVLKVKPQQGNPPAWEEMRTYRFSGR